MKDLEKMLAKKSGKDKMPEKEANAKLEVLMELLQQAEEAMGSRVKSGMEDMQKVSVMAPDKESLKAGLEKAQELTSSNALEELAAKPSEESSEEGEEVQEEKSEEDDEMEMKPKRKFSNFMSDED